METGSLGVASAHEAQGRRQHHGGGGPPPAQEAVSDQPSAEGSASSALDPAGAAQRGGVGGGL